MPAPPVLSSRFAGRRHRASCAEFTFKDHAAQAVRHDVEMSADQAAVLSSIASAISALLTLVAVTVAVLSLRASREDSRQADANSAEDRRAQSRPMLVPEFQKEPLSQGAVNFVIRNWGRSAATNVTVDWLSPTPPADLATLPNDNVLKWLYRSYVAPIALWPPRWRMSHVYIWGHDDKKGRESIVKVRVSYQGPDGHSYSEDFTLDPGPILSQTQSSPSKPGSSDWPAWVKDAALSLRAISRGL